MAVHVTAAQARALGVDTKLGAKRRVSRTAKGPYLTRCVACDEVFTQRSDEDKHLDRTGHRNYRLILD